MAKPRFVTLAHPTLSKILIRAGTKPTNEQFFDMILHFENSPRNTEHKTAGILPKLKSPPTLIRRCNNPRCTTCAYLNCKPFFTSKVTNVRYSIRHSATCSSSNVIYLITCTKCKKQYVGLTTKPLRTRINHHLSNIFLHTLKFSRSQRRQHFSGSY